MDMEINLDLNTRLIDLTLGDLLAVFGHPKEPKEQIDYTGDKYVHGISGIAKLLGVSKTMVWQYRKSGWIEPAIRQNGRKIICNAPLALELFGKNKRYVC